MPLQSHVPFPTTWVTCKTIIKILSSIVISYVLNQSCGHWFFWGHFSLCHHQDTSLLLPFLIQCYKAFMPFVFGEEVQVQSSDPQCNDHLIDLNNKYGSPSHIGIFQFVEMQIYKFVEIIIFVLVSKIFLEQLKKHFDRQKLF